MSDAEEDSDCRALMLTGTSHAFCSGQDLRERISKDGKTTVLGSALETYYNPLVRKLRALPFPVVAAVNGVAAGAGANIALACSMWCSRSASFVQLAKIGLVPDSGGTWFLPRLVARRTRGMALTGDPLCQEGRSLGLILEVVDDLVLMAEAHRLCVTSTEAPTVALALIKRLLDKSWADDSLDARHSARARDPARASPSRPVRMRAFFKSAGPSAADLKTASVEGRGCDLDSGTTLLASL